MTLSRTNGEAPKWVVIFFLEKDTLRKNIEIIEEFVENFDIDNDKPWKSSKILRVNTKTFESFDDLHSS